MGFIGVQPTSVPLTASDITDGIISNAKLGADSVNATKISDDSISDEHLDITSITGQTAITSLADTDKFLVSDASDSGNLKYVENQYLGGGGAMTLISNVEGTSSVGDVSINDCFSATYDNYFIIYTLSPDRDGNYINFRFLKDDDSTFDTGYNVVLFGYDESANLRTTINGSHSDFPLHQSDVKNDTTELFGTVIGYMYVYHPYTLNVGGSDLLRRARVVGQSHQIKSNGNIATYSYAGQIKQNSENVAGIRFRPNANYITHRRVRVYGLADS